jgi:hypothetical protein
MRHIRQDGLLYLCAEDLALVILNIADGLAQDPCMTAREAFVASYVAERLGYAIVGGNLLEHNITVEDIGG